MITYPIASALAIGYVCETGLPFWRRAAASVLGLVLAVGTGQLLTSSDPLVGYVVGIPSLLVLGVIMIAPERKVRPGPTVDRRAAARVQSAVAAGPWEVDRRASRRRTPTPVPTDRIAAFYTRTAAEITRVTPAGQVSRTSAATRVPGGAVTSLRGAADGHLAARRRHSRRGAPRSLSRMSRCRYR
jgi:hypothetical protein